MQFLSPRAQERPNNRRVFICLQLQPSFSQHSAQGAQTPLRLPLRLHSQGLFIFLSDAQRALSFPSFPAAPQIHFTCSVVGWLPFELAVGGAMFLQPHTHNFCKKKGDKKVSCIVKAKHLIPQQGEGLCCGRTVHTGIPGCVSQAEGDQGVQDTPGHRGWRFLLPHLPPLAVLGAQHRG